MKPDAYMRLYPGDWLRDTMHLDATAMGAYFLLILAHRGKPGLPDDDGALRMITRVRECDWARVKGQVVGFFSVTGGMWVNKRCVEDWERDCQDYATQMQRTAKARSHNPNNRTVTRTVTDTVTVPVTEQQSESESESIEEREKEAPEIPPMSRKAFDALAELRGVPKDCAEWFWNTHDARNWLDSRGQPIRKVEPLLLNTLKAWRANTRPANGAKVNGAASELILAQAELKRIEERLKAIRGAASEDAWGPQYDEVTRDEIKQLKAKAKQLKSKLGFAA